MDGSSEISTMYWVQMCPPQHARSMFWSIEILPLEIVVVEDFALAPFLAPRRCQLQLAHDVVGETAQARIVSIFRLVGNFQVVYRVSVQKETLRITGEVQ